MMGQTALMRRRGRNPDMLLSPLDQHFIRYSLQDMSRILNVTDVAQITIKIVSFHSNL